LSKRIGKMAKEEQRIQDMERIERLFREAEQRSNDNADAVGKAHKQCHLLSEALKTRVQQKDFD
jgi:Holliday junction resolvasome RuvABC endonuclease subunit